MNERNTDSHATALKELFKLIDTLIGPKGCPWDKKQTPESMCDYLAEETFELIEEIRNGHIQGIMEELGDVMFILQFIATLYENNDDFTLADALKASSQKMIRRHPHVFADKKINTLEALHKNWEETKKLENTNSTRTRVFDSLPTGLPPLLKAYRIHSKAAANDFTWATDAEVEEQMHEEWEEWTEALRSQDNQSQEIEFGDYLFTLVELGRRKGIKANAALAYANHKFLQRFQKMEELAQSRGIDFSQLDSKEKNILWREVKTQE